MTRLPVVDFRVMHKVLLQLGFQNVRQKGSHVFYRHNDGRTTTLPNHKGRDIARPLLREVLREIEISPDVFKDLIREL
ncbi:type II toxin-antitoxin system HicA family toxin [bacterium]|nr:type II toxin-antitoxin system HicA family toxin [bacterium]MBU1651896.1 type II toxin-antitoxin system HicA family toxin [bacterium]